MVSWWVVIAWSCVAFALGMFCMALCAIGRIADDRAELLRLAARIEELEDGEREEGVYE